MDGKESRIKRLSIRSAILGMERTLVHLLFFCVTLGALAYPADGPAKPKVYVTSYPLKYFTERVAGDMVEVLLPVSVGMNPVFWMPDVATITAMQSADLIIINGATFEKWLTVVSLPSSKIVNTSENFRDQYIKVKDAVTHSHGPQGQHSHAGIRYTTWINFRLASRQAQAIEKALTTILPNSRKALEAGCHTLKKDLMALDQAVDRVVSRSRNQPLLASHPVYDYFARRYSLNLRSVLWVPGVMPNPGQWKTLEAVLAHHPARWMIWEGDPIQEAVEKLKSMGINSLVFDPCGNVPNEADFLSVMWQNVENLSSAF